jgi:hypothetical protein
VTQCWIRLPKPALAEMHRSLNATASGVHRGSRGQVYEGRLTFKAGVWDGAGGLANA